MRLVGFSKLLPLLLLLMASTTTTATDSTTTSDSSSTTTTTTGDSTTTTATDSSSTTTTTGDSTTTTTTGDSTTTTTEDSTTTTTTGDSTTTTTTTGDSTTTTTTGDSTTTTTTGDSTTTTTGDSTTTTTTGDSTTTTTTGDSITTTTGDSTTTTTTGDSTTTTTTDDSTTTTTTTMAPLTGKDLYQKTQDELNQITDILNKFEKLVEPAEEDAPSMTSKRYAWVGRAHPAMWWLRGEEQQETGFDFCNEENKDEEELCHTLEGQLDETDKLVTRLRENMDDWKNADLDALQQQREGLSGTYEEANKDQDSFVQSVDTDKFTKAIDEVNQNVEYATNDVEKKIDDLTSNGSVALVAVLGTLGGLMIVALVGVIVYKFVKKPKTSSKTSGAPYDKLEGENIPIGRVTQGAQGSLQASRMDPYSQPQAHSSRRDPAYAAPYGPRSESSYGARSESAYGRPATSDAGRSLPRAHL